jgi:hypothetical protein
MPSERFNKAFGRGAQGMNDDLDERNAKALEMLKNIPGSAVEAVRNVFSSGYPETAVPQVAPGDAKPMGSYFGPGNEPPLGEVDTGGLSTEEVQKAQKAERDKKALQDYAARQKAMAMPPMEVPKSRAEQLDPRLINPENYRRFQNMVDKLKK